MRLLPCVASQFQSTLPCGSDYHILCLVVHGRYFNPRSLAGATRIFNSTNSITALFQSTLPCGSDRSVFAQFAPSCNFNPRSLAGATCLFCKRPHCLKISIHAPLRERRFFVKFYAADKYISIHAPLRERL